MVEDGREPAIAEGAGTIGLELLRWPEVFDSILVPLGDGALLGGIACWVKAHSPCTRLIGVCAARSPAMERSWHQGQVVTGPCSTIADGIAIETPSPQAVARLNGLLDDVLLVEDEMLIEAIRLGNGHAAGPNGLIGGYPVNVDADGVRIDLPSDLSLDEAIALNHGFCRAEGIVLRNNTYRLTKNADEIEQMTGIRLDDSLLSWCPDALDDQAARLDALRSELDAVSVN